MPSRSRSPRNASDLNVVAIGRDPRTGERSLLVRGQDSQGKWREALLSDTHINAGQAKICSVLRQAGLRLPWVTADQHEILRHLEDQAPTERFRVASQLGWLESDRPVAANPIFVLPEKFYGKSPKPVRIQLRDDYPTRKFAKAGTLANWQTSVAALADGNAVAIFATCLAFVSPILQLLDGLNAGFQLVAPSSSGKSLCGRLAASVWGGSTIPFHETWLTTLNNVDRTASDHNGTLLVLDETGLAKSTSRSVGSVVLDAIYRLAEGRYKGRLTDGARLDSWKLYYLSTSEKTLAQLAASFGITLAEGELGRLIDISPPVSTQMGIFQDLHGAADLTEFARRLIAALTANSGTAGPAYIKGIVAWLERDSVGLRAWLDARISVYKRNWQKTPPLVGQRVLQSVATVYAAGCLAQKLGILSWTFTEMGAAIRYCHEHTPDYDVQSQSADPIYQIKSFIQKHRRDFVKLSPGGSKKALPPDALGVIYTRPSGVVEYLFPPATFWGKVCVGLYSKMVVAVLKNANLITLHAGNKWTVTRSIGGRQVRMICIKKAILE